MNAQARDAVLQNIGIAEQLVPQVSGPPFSLSTAVWLAGIVCVCVRVCVCKCKIQNKFRYCLVSLESWGTS